VDANYIGVLGNFAIFPSRIVSRVVSMNKYLLSIYSGIIRTKHDDLYLNHLFYSLVHVDSNLLLLLVNNAICLD
jgi:hypothetical protein